MVTTLNKKFDFEIANIYCLLQEKNVISYIRIVIIQLYIMTVYLLTKPQPKFIYLFFFLAIDTMFPSQKNMNLIKNLFCLNCQEITQNTRTYFARLLLSKGLWRVFSRQRSLKIQKHLFSLSWKLTMLLISNFMQMIDDGIS